MAELTETLTKNIKIHLVQNSLTNPDSLKLEKVRTTSGPLSSRSAVSDDDGRVFCSSEALRCL